MIGIALLVLQNPLGMSTFPPPDERLSFIFTRDPHAQEEKISGSLTTPTEWSTPSFFRMVKGCGAKRVGVESKDQLYITVNSDHGANDMDVVRCVQASTSVRFAAGVKRRGNGSTIFDEEPFRALWSK